MGTLKEAGSHIYNGMSWSYQVEGHDYWSSVKKRLCEGRKDTVGLKPLNQKDTTNALSKQSAIEAAIDILVAHNAMPDVVRRLRAKLKGQGKCGTAPRKLLLCSK